jgi:hypothetical protein
VICIFVPSCKFLVIRNGIIQGGIVKIVDRQIIIPSVHSFRVLNKGAAPYQCCKCVFLDCLGVGSSIIKVPDQPVVVFTVEGVVFRLYVAAFR